MVSRHSQKQTVVWERLSDGILLSGLGASLLFFGGRHPWGHAALMLGGLLAAGLIVVGRIIHNQGRIHRTGAGWLLLGGASIPLLQMIPLPEAWLSFLAPQLKHILPAWNHGTTASLLGGWHCLSLAPEETRVALSLWLAYSLIFFYTVQRIEDIGDVERVLRWLVPIIIALSIVGLLQYLFSNNKFLWLYAHPFTKTSDAVKAVFTNRNHFASLVALSAGPLLWWYLADRRFVKKHRSADTDGVATCATDSGLRHLKWLTLPVVLLALLLTQSRGGTLAAVVALFIGGVALYRTGWLKTRWIGVFLLGLAFLMAAVLIVGTDTIARRWEGVVQLSWEQLDRGDARRTVWRNTWRAAQDFLITGSGCGSFSAVHPLYQTVRSGPLYYTHAENGYLQVLLETGLPGVVLLALACMTLAIWSWQGWHFAPTTRHRTATGVVTAGLVAFAFHGLVDYVWYVPGLAAVVAILIGCLARLNQIARSDVQEASVPSRVQWVARQSRYSVPWAIPVMGLLLCGLWEIPAAQRAFFSGVSEFSWHQYLTLYRTADWSDTERSANQAAADENENVSQMATEPAVQNGNASTVSESLSETATLTQENGETLSGLIVKEQEMISLLVTILRQNPGRAEAHLRLAKACLRLFHLVQEQSPNPMPLSQIRDAVVLSGFSSQEELNQWLQVAIGDHIQLLRRARQEALSAVRLCPLLGEAYFILGQLSFLDGGREEDVIAWFRQSLAVRPRDGELLFRVGAEFALMGSQDEAMALWRQAFQCGRFYQYRLIERLIGRVPPDQIGQEIAFLIETFEPDLEILRYMYRQYRKRYTPEWLEPLRRAYTVALAGQLRDDNSPPSKRAELWLELHFLYLDGEDHEQALQCAEQAVRCDPLDYRAHHYLSLRLEEMGRFAEAEEHVRWCLQRRPGHRSLQNRLHNLYQKRMKMEDEQRGWRMAELVSPGNSPPNR